MIPSGISILCENSPNTDYSTSGTGSSSFQWGILPSTAGQILGSSSTVTVDWNTSFSGNAKIFVKAIAGGFCESETSDTLFVIVKPLPEKASLPVGLTSLCVNNPNTTYTTLSQNSTSYLWNLNPSGCGLISGNGTTATVDWNDQYIGSATITVQGINSCGQGATSNPLSVGIFNLPPVPTISQNGNTLISSYSVGNQWYFNGNLLFGDTLQTFLPTSSGVFTVQVKNSHGCTSLSDPYQYNVGVVEHSPFSFLNIYPNPTKGEFHLELELKQKAELSIEIMNIFAKTVFHNVLYDCSGKCITSVDLGDFPDGVYFLKLKAGDKSIVEKVFLLK